MGKILAVCSSKKKGTRKGVMRNGVLKQEYGLVGDAHANSDSHRQISLLAIESINKMRDMGYDVSMGDFAENLTTDGIHLFSLPVGTKLEVGNDVTLEITQIGKECHTKCAIFRQVGKCVMPEEGVFARVLCGGVVHTGDSIKTVI